uniref:Putative secreted protein n=1 Tax=Ixodes ricinus TaxID=34613 RepID=A0A6B0TYC0_IXORI
MRPRCTRERRGGTLSVCASLCPPAGAEPGGREAALCPVASPVSGTGAAAPSSMDGRSCMASGSTPERWLWKTTPCFFSVTRALPS